MVTGVHLAAVDVFLPVCIQFISIDGLCFHISVHLVFFQILIFVVDGYEGVSDWLIFPLPPFVGMIDYSLVQMDSTVCQVSSDED